MALWLAAIPAMWVAKKAYDAWTEEDVPSSSGSSKPYESNENLKRAKILRTSERRLAIKGLIKEHRERQKSDLLRVAKDIGASVERRTPASYVVRHQSTGDQVQSLEKVRRLFTDKELKQYQVLETKVSHLSEGNIVNKAIKQAEEEYGEFDGIDHLNNYDINADSYVKYLIKHKYSILY
ncbi:hypothetical protein [Vibrio cyclitrophicus]|uniref:hypothetical protein n=1 Tax=Vibrio cyclitrophicus TaxID=47951 RepID=UPI000301F734|nr:hypothetical protein [Vibrio cyclitrophicus]ERM57978.1 hypothetical protein M565_ctg5P0949 [Vibrio cyclitrophicus FF75]OEE49849.1 hypothetical protein OAG_00080 [Vibrio cyclitrophicus FF75]